MRGLAMALALLMSSTVLAGRSQHFDPTWLAPEGEHRVALVIGNGGYQFAPLRNPVNDARAMATALRGSGFAVTLLEDATQAGMRHAIRDFGDELARSTVGLFYYAGHGMQVQGSNYLIPVNADIAREDEVPDQAVNANLVLTKMESARNALNIVILDACRNNPFARVFRSAVKGLAQMDAPSGTLIAYSTAPGSVAEDGEGENSTYTRYLLEAIPQPGLPVERLFKQVRINVAKQTGDRQIPWESSSLRGDFFFQPAPALGATADQQLAIAKAAQEATQAVEERARREREELRRRMEQAEQEALARQLAKMEAEISSAAARSNEQSIVVASSTSAGTLQVNRTVVPKVGDRWEYVVVEPYTRKSAKYTVTATQIAGASIRERITGQNISPLSVTHAPGAYLVNAGFLQFSPYLLAYEDVAPGRRYDDVATVRIACNAQWDCSPPVAQVLSAERVTVAAGTFDAIKVVVSITVRSVENFWVGNAELTYWIAPQARRIVKARARAYNPSTKAFPIDEFDLELASYKPG
jgi:uncharacterized caspase-like protein